MIINCLNIAEMNDENYKLFHNAVSQERRKKSDRYHFSADSYRSTCAELLLQYSLYKMTGQNIEINIAYHKFGKPFMKNRSDFFYNISHSGDWVVIAYGNSEVGIDIEKIRYGKEPIIDRFFTKEEENYIYSVSGKEKDKRFTQIWTLKESYIKYLGTGLSMELNSFSISAEDGRVSDNTGKIQEDIMLNSRQYAADYFLSVCGKEKEIIVHELKLEDLIHFIYRKEEM